MTHVDKNRLFWLVVGVLALMGLITVRLVYLQVIKHDFMWKSRRVRSKR